MRNLWFVLLVVLAACAPAMESGVDTPIVITAEMSTVLPDIDGTGLPILTPEPPTPVPTLLSGTSIAELKYHVLEEFPDFFFCDPDYYPVAREDEMVLAQQRFAELQANAEEFQAILAHNGLSGSSSFTDDQKLLIYRENKKLNAIYFELTGAVYRFQIQTGSEGQEGRSITATIDGDGSIGVLQEEQGFPTCPICLAAGTLIDTPRGTIRVEALQVGDSVWTTNEAGDRVQAVILKAGHIRVPAGHEMVHVQVDDGRELWASAGHPTADGRIFADLKLGDTLDGERIVAVEYVQYDGTTTFDILPSGDTGNYWANGILVGSTLHE